MEQERDCDAKNGADPYRMYTYSKSTQVITTKIIKDAEKEKAPEVREQH